MSDYGLTSMDFYSTRSRGFITVVATITLLIIVLMLIYVGLYAISQIPKACTTAPSPPTNLQAGYMNAGSFRVLWTAVADVKSYTVYVGQTAAFSRTQSINITTTNRTYADIKGLETGRTYYIMVTASNNCGESANSSKITFVYVQP